MERNIETERLFLRPLQISDYQEVYSWVSDKIVNKYLPYPVYTDVENVKKWIASISPYDFEFIIGLKSEKKIIGCCSVGFLKKDKVFEVGCTVKREYWQCGYGTEACKAVIDWTHSHFGAKKFIGIHANENFASGAILKKCGFTFDHFCTLNGLVESKTFEASYYVLNLE